jgi:hypothetical protein
MRRSLAAILYVFLGLPLALSALLLISVRPWALDRETYRRFVQDDRLYAALQAPEMAARAPETISLGPAKFDGPALTAAAQKNLPLPEIKATASRAVDAALDAFEGRGAGGAGGGSMALDLRPLKLALQSKSPAIARDYASALAAAGAEAQALPGLVRQPAEAAKALGAAVAAMPDTARASLPPPTELRRLRGPMGILTRGPGPGEALTQALLNRMTATTAAISALLLAGLGALGGTSALSRLSRGGRYLLLPSILVLAFGVVLAIPGGLILQNVLPNGLRGMLGGAAGAQLRAYLASALGPIARGFFLTGLVGASIGGVLSQAKRLAEPKELE